MDDSNVSLKSFLGLRFKILAIQNAKGFRLVLLCYQLKGFV